MHFRRRFINLWNHLERYQSQEIGDNKDGVSAYKDLSQGSIDNNLDGINDNWTFVDINTQSSVITRFLKLNAVYSIGMVINLGLLLVLTEKFGAYYLISNLFGIACATTFNFFWAKRYVWRPCQ